MRIKRVAIIIMIMIIMIIIIMIIIIVIIIIIMMMIQPLRDDFTLCLLTNGNSKVQSEKIQVRFLGRRD